MSVKLPLVLNSGQVQQLQTSSDVLDPRIIIIHAGDSTPGADITYTDSIVIVATTPYFPDEGILIDLEGNTVLVLSPDSSFTMGSISLEPSDYTSLGNDRIELRGTDPLIIDSPILFTLTAGTLLVLEPDDWTFTGKVINRQGNMTLNA